MSIVNQVNLGQPLQFMCVKTYASRRILGAFVSGGSSSSTVQTDKIKTFFEGLDV